MLSRAKTPRPIERGLEASTKDTSIIQFGHPIGMECSTKTIYFVLHCVQHKVFNKGIFTAAISAEEKLNRALQPHRNRLDFFAPLFLSRKKVEWSEEEPQCFHKWDNNGAFLSSALG